MKKEDVIKLIKLEMHYLLEAPNEIQRFSNIQNIPVKTFKDVCDYVNESYKLQEYSSCLMAQIYVADRHVLSLYSQKVKINQSWSEE